MTPLQIAVRGVLNELPANVRAQLTDRRAAIDVTVCHSVSDIIERVRCDGDVALRALALTHDRADVAELEVPREEWVTALGALPPDVRDAMQHAADNIARVHAAWLPQHSEMEVEPGVHVLRRPLPLDRVGVYAPGGRAAYPSSLLMGVIPARVAGAREIVVCSPPLQNGRPAASVMAAAEIAGATRLFGVGGAGAIAAMALGTLSIPRVDCIVGPGNAYVTEAKLQLTRTVRTDLPAGPSELLIVADDSADLCAVAAELCAQAEHGADSAVLAVLIGADLTARLEASLVTATRELQRRDIVRAAFASRGALLEAQSIDEALAFADAYAPEHLLIATRDAARLAELPRTAGAVFVGLTSSVAFGDYITGANHVLPTLGYARTHSGLSTETFMRWTTVQTVEPLAARRLAPLTSAFAIAEGLRGHAAAAQRAGTVQ
ncbi:MAG: histidinol dehydrogenase [Gemmatimonadaceae bacterium]